MRHARQDDQREREGPFCSAMKAQDDNPLSRAVQSSTTARFDRRQSSVVLVVALCLARRRRHPYLVLIDLT